MGVWLAELTALFTIVFKLVLTAVLLEVTMMLLAEVPLGSDALLMVRLSPLRALVVPLRLQVTMFTSGDGDVDVGLELLATVESGSCTKS